MKVLVTGATGFIGSHLVEELLRRDYEVTCLVRKTSNLQWLDGLDITLLYGDCEDRESLFSAVKGQELILHLAGLTKAKKARDFFRINTLGTENLVSVVAQAEPNIRKFVFLSSLAAVGPSRNGKPVNEDTLPQPVSEYGRSKLQAEEAVLKFKNHLPVTIIRPPAVYGPRDKDLYVFYRMLKKGIFPYWGMCYYSLIYVDDLVKAITEIGVSTDTYGETYFVSDGNIYSNVDIANAISQAVGSRPIRLRIPNRFLPIIASIGGILSRKTGIINIDKIKEICYPRWVCDSSKANMKFGFLPKTKIKEGITWTANWYKIHRWL
ncbi:MAG: NAD-dependent epimerase/dehydratase family protein [Nitrospirae bacterium]|nr:NAD-dependent epimerase/dehydratase family protein [Nitrospirota bacterium]